MSGATLAGAARGELPASGIACVHCGGAMAAGQRFCCTGCGAAFETIQRLGLGNYYRDVVRDTLARRLRPSGEPRTDLARHIRTAADGSHELILAVDGLQCGA